MIYSVDTCVLLDILLPDPVHGIPSREVLKKASENGRLHPLKHFARHSQDATSCAVFGAEPRSLEDKD